MRKSVKKDDPGYDPIAYRYDVFLNGKELKHCHTADEEMGAVWVYDFEPKDHLGRSIPARFWADMMSKKLTGKVILKCRQS